ncbi:MAG: hypothetical protein HZB64_07105 [Rhodocyclales bacterium]|nr:hypothetical protein [Rhodocyclales bacterium]
MPVIAGDPNAQSVELVAAALRLTLPSGTAINLISAPAFLATKFEAFRTRGRADLLQSHDFEDIINVIEGRQSIVEEVGAGGTALRGYLGQQLAAIMRDRTS